MDYKAELEKFIRNGYRGYITFLEHLEPEKTPLHENDVCKWVEYDIIDDIDYYLFIKLDEEDEPWLRLSAFASKEVYHGGCSNQMGHYTVYIDVEDFIGRKNKNNETLISLNGIIKGLINCAKETVCIESIRLFTSNTYYKMGFKDANKMSEREIDNIVEVEFQKQSIDSARTIIKKLKPYLQQQ